MIAQIVGKFSLICRYWRQIQRIKIVYKICENYVVIGDSKLEWFETFQVVRWKYTFTITI